MLSAKQQASAFVMEVVLVEILNKRNIRKKALEYFNQYDSKQQAIIKDYLNNPKLPHAIFMGLSFQDKIDFCKLQGVMGNPQTALSILEETFPNSEILLENLFGENEKALSLISTLYALWARKGNQKASEVGLLPIDDWQTHKKDADSIVQLLIENFGMPPITWEETPSVELCAAIFVETLKLSLNPNAEKSQKLNKVLSHMWPQTFKFLPSESHGLDENLKVISETMKDLDATEYTIRDFTQSIRNGKDLFARMEMAAEQSLWLTPLRCSENCFGTVNYSAVNIAAVMENGHYPNTLRPRIAKETVTKEDRNIALNVAWEGFVDIKEFIEENDLNEDTDFFFDPELDEFVEEADPVKCRQLLLFQNTYIAALYNILATRVYFKDMAVAITQAIYGTKNSTAKNGDVSEILKKTTEKYEKQKEKLQKTEKALTESEQRNRQLSKKLEGISTVNNNEQNKNHIIESQQVEIKCLEHLVENLQKQIDANQIVEEDVEENPVVPDLTDAEVHERLAKLLNKYRVLLVDGHENFCRLLTNAQPNIRTIPNNTKIPSESDVANKDYVFCKSPAHGSHKMSKAVQVYAERCGVPFRLLSRVTNIPQTEREIFNALKTLDKERSC